MNCPFCATELIDTFHDNLWKDVAIDTDDYYYCVRCELTFDKDHLLSQSTEGGDQIPLLSVR